MSGGCRGFQASTPERSLPERHGILFDANRTLAVYKFAPIHFTCPGRRRGSGVSGSNNGTMNVRRFVATFRAKRNLTEVRDSRVSGVILSGRYVERAELGYSRMPSFTKDLFHNRADLTGAWRPENCAVFSFLLMTRFVIILIH